jgi:hypothetical protein
MSKLKWKAACAKIREAGYHNDMKTMIQVYVENRISYDTAREHYFKGQEMRKQGVPCMCYQCKQASQQKPVELQAFEEV